MQALDTLAWMAVALAIQLVRAYPHFTPALNHDSFQYLSAAQNALSGHVGYTSLVHFDVERSFGQIPAPMLTFAPGYPLTVAALSVFGLSSTTAALLVGVLSMLACIPLLAWASARLGLSRSAGNAVIACFVLNGAVVEFATFALSEALFTMLVLLGAVTLVAARTRVGASAQATWIGAGLAFGAAYSVRYAGLFFIAGLALLLGRHLIARRLATARGYALALATSGTFVALGVIRNLLIVGNWRGRDEMLLSTSLVDVAVQTGHSINALLLGTGTGRVVALGTFGPKVACLGFLALGLTWLAWLRWSSDAAPALTVEPAPEPSAVADLLWLSVAYAACMVYAGTVSSISYGSARNFLPVLPIMLLVAAATLGRVLGRTAGGNGPIWPAAAALSISLACYAYLNALVMLRPLVDQATAVARLLDEPDSRGNTMRGAILSRVGPTDAVLANNGQAMGYVLNRATVSMVGPTFSTVVWDAATVRKTVRQFGIKAVVVQAPIVGQPEEDDIPSEFVAQLANGVAPDWLRLVHRHGPMRVYVPAETGL